MYINEAGWVAIGFCIFCIIAWRYGAKPFADLLDNRGKEIKGKLEEAEALRMEAKEVLQKYKILHEQAEIDSKNIIKKAEENAKLFQIQAEQNAKNQLKRQEAQTKQKIINAEKKAIFEIRNLTVDLAISASETILSNELDEKKSENLVQQSIKNININ